MRAVKLSQPSAQIFVPDGLAPADALARATHLAIGSHPDDLELMTWHGILGSLGRDDRWFAGVVVTDGAGSPRAGRYADIPDDEMRAVRWAEQKKAAAVGEYAALVHLGWSSGQVKAVECQPLVDDLANTLALARPRVVYTHSLFDAHDTHVAVAVHAIRAIRSLPVAARPSTLYGCEVWRSLDWLPDPDRVALDVSGREHTAAALIGVYDSQIAGGKRYDQAALGRRRANATFGDPRAVDHATAVEHAMDLSPLIADDTLDIRGFAADVVRRFADSVVARLGRYLA